MQQKNAQRNTFFSPGIQLAIKPRCDAPMTATRGRAGDGSVKRRKAAAMQRCSAAKGLHLT